MADVKLMPPQVAGRAPKVSSSSSSQQTVQQVRVKPAYFLEALQAFLLVPVFPLLGYYLLDQTGISQWMVVNGLIPSAILGEGFGHVGLCFSIHYVFTGLRALVKGVSELLHQ